MGPAIAPAARAPPLLKPAQNEVANTNANTNTICQYCRNSHETRSAKNTQMYPCAAAREHRAGMMSAMHPPHRDGCRPAWGCSRACGEAAAGPGRRSEPPPRPRSGPSRVCHEARRAARILESLESVLTRCASKIRPRRAAARSQGSSRGHASAGRAARGYRGPAVPVAAKKAQTPPARLFTFGGHAEECECDLRKFDGD